MTVVVEVGLVVKASVVGFGAWVLECAAVLGMVCIWAFTSWAEVSIMVVGVVPVVSAGGTSFVVVFLDSWVVFIEVLVVMLTEVSTGSVIVKGVGR